VTFYTGLIILAAATLLFGLAKASWVLLISRICQGFSAAIVYTVGLALLVDTVGRDNIGQWMGTALSSSSFGLIVSPLLGGVVYAKAGYMAVFGMAMALIIVDILMRLFMIEKKTAAKYKPLEDVTQQSGFYGTFTHPETAEHEHSNGSTQPKKPNDDPEEAPLLSGGGERPSEKKSRIPTIIVLLSIPRLLAAIYGIFVNVAVLAAFDGVLPLYVKRIFDWNSLNAGLIFLCLAVPALTGPLVGKLVDKLGPRWIAVAGCTLTAPPLILLRLVDHDSMEQKILLCGLLVCCGQYSSNCSSMHVHSYFILLLQVSTPVPSRFSSSPQIVIQ
jgi:MFS family permease